LSLPYEFYVKELEQARATCEAGEKISLSRLETLQAESAQEQAEITARLDAAHADIETKRKEKARAAWVNNGGDNARFDTVWENSLRDELLKKDVIENKASPQFFNSL
jgi:hypothetical protein